MRRKRVTNEIDLNNSASSALENLSVSSATTAVSQDSFKVYREPLEHPMFRGRIEWIGAWILIHAAADQKTNRVNLTDVGRKADCDFGWDNDRWRRFVKRLEKEGFVATVEKKNFGNKIGHVHIALLIYPGVESSYEGSNAGAFHGATRVQNVLTDDQSAPLARSGLPSSAEAEDGATVGAGGREPNEGVWLIVDDADDEDVS